ncbi:MAG: T9SS type A sorting domain-containing protein [Flavipsychrobacter sp.]|nr:T9SS type A sorting domain-containing protein [Flavipsychrobacter sp.]
MLKRALLICLVLVGAWQACFAQLVSFPGAEGAGSYTTGGRGTPAVPTTVFYVTSLADNSNSTTGTLRWALNQTATYRTIVFAVSGTIHLKSALRISKANTTIAGQTAPGCGICIADYPVSVTANNVIVRYIRFRMGDKHENLGMVNGSGNDDAFDGTGYKNIIIDHCTMSWSDDEACTFYRGDSTTLQWNLISEPLNYSYHFETGDADYEHHGFGGIWGGKHFTGHHNLLADCKGRAARFDGCRNLQNGSPATGVTGLENADFVNNVIYNWGDYNTNGGEGGNYNILNNYYKSGPSTLATGTSGIPVKSMIIQPYKQTTAPVLPYGKYYMTGNYVEGYPAVTADNWRGAAMNGGSLADTASAKVNVAFTVNPPVNMQSAQDAYDSVLLHVGATLPQRDTLDQRIINDVINNTGKLIDVQGGFPHGTAYSVDSIAWPYLCSAPAPADMDKDGMPDWWETLNGLDSANASDRNGYAPNGYTNLENYLNGISDTAGGVIDTSHNDTTHHVGIITVNTGGNNIKVFPNPASGNVHVSILHSGEAIVVLLDLTGIKRYEVTLPVGTNDVLIPTAALSPGVYIIKYSSGTDIVNTKFIKQ